MIETRRSMGLASLRKGSFVAVTSLVLLSSVVTVHAIEKTGVPIEVAGTVVDGSGRPLRSVEMTVFERRTRERTFETAVTRRRATIDGMFEVKCAGCSDIDLRFEASGYYPRDVEFELTPDERETLLAGGPPPDFAIVRRGLVIEMQPSGEVVVLERVDFTLDLTSEGPQQVLVREDRRSSMEPHRDVVEKRRSGQRSENPAFVALSVDSDRFHAVLGKARGNGGSEDSGLDAFLEFTGAESGVLSFHSSGSGPGDILRQMTEAPESGYASTLAVGPDQRGDQFFYCRIDGQYCKGRVSPVRSGWGRDARPKLEVGVVMYCNREGNRNLNALRH